MKSPVATLIDLLNESVKMYQEAVVALKFSRDKRRKQNKTKTNDTQH
jgi:hypothetical protein